MGERPSVDITTPVHWVTRHFWVWRGRRAFGLVAAFAPTVMAIGGEAIVGDSKGFALMLGPVWLGFATLRLGGKDA